MKKCPRRNCNGTMHYGKALLNTADYGCPDFIGDHRGMTFSMTGPAGLINVLECSACGYSVMSEESWKKVRE